MVRMQPLRRGPRLLLQCVEPRRQQEKIVKIEKGIFGGKERMNEKREELMIESMVSITSTMAVIAQELDEIIKTLKKINRSLEGLEVKV